MSAPAGATAVDAAGVTAAAAAARSRLSQGHSGRILLMSFSFLITPFCSSSVISLLLLRILTHTHIQYIQYTYTHTTTDTMYFLVPRHF